jgi:tetratricopeptide (TPR) repeat protein
LNGRKEEAEAKFQHALQIDPNHVPALLHVAVLSAAAGRMEEAEKICRQLSAVDPRQFGQVYPTLLAREGKLPEAIAVYQRVVQSYPENYLASTGLVITYLRLNRASEAQQVVDRALRVNPKDLHALLLKAQLFLRRGDYRGAQEPLSAALAYQPASAMAHYLLAKVYERQNAFTQRRTELNTALRLNPALLSARLELARSLIQNKNAHEALDLLNHAPAEQQTAPAFIAQSGWTYLALGDKNGFSKTVAIGLSANNPESLVQDGVFKLLQKDFAGAQQSLEKALERNPADLRALDALLESYSRQHRPELALAKIRYYATRQPPSPGVQVMAGTWLAGHGKTEEARTAFLAAEQTAPRNTPAKLALAKLDLTTHNYEAARGRLTSVLALDDHNLTARLLLGTLEESTGHEDAAIAQYRGVLDFAPSDAMALNNLAYLLSKRPSRLDEALNYAQHAMEMAPDDSNTNDTLGWVLFRKGLYQSALTHLQAAAKSARAVPKYHLATDYFKLNQISLGKQVLAEAQKADPTAAELALAKQAMAEAQTKTLSQN